MKTRIILCVVLMCLSRHSFALASKYEPVAGDFVFQSLPHADLVDAIEGVSRSPYSHVGLVVHGKNGWFVREALSKVIDTPLSEWINRGRDQHAFHVYRLKTDFQSHIPQLIKHSAAFLGLPYDFKYAMDDEKIYCSELIYKAMLKASGIRLGKLQKLSELNWQPYQKTIEIYEEGAVPLNREMITPQSLSEAHQLTQVYSSYKK